MCSVNKYIVNLSSENQLKMAKDKSDLENNVSIEVALNRAGYGLYSHLLSGFAGVAVISYACIGFGGTILAPTSACELETTAAQQGLVTASPVVGSIIGTLIWGYLADTRGRRKMLLVALIGGAFIYSFASLSVNWIMLMFLQFAASIFACGFYSMSLSILSESIPMAKRNVVVLIVASIFLLSQGVMSVLAIPIIPLTFSYYLPTLGIYWNSWRTLVLAYSMPALISAIWIFFMQESPKFVYEKGDEAQALEILKTIHRINHWTSNEKFEVTGLVKEASAAAQPEEKSQISGLFKAPYLKYTVIMAVLFSFQVTGSFSVWLPTIADQFVRILETGEGSNQTLCAIISSRAYAPVNPDVAPCSLNVRALLIVLVVAGMQATINLLLSLVVNRFGRRNLVIIITSICGVSGILVNLMPNAASSVAFFAILLMGMIVLGLYTAIIVALFPTHLKAIAFAVPLTVARIATFGAIQVLNLMLINSCDAGFYVFASIFGSSAIVASFLPDDRRLKPAAVKPVPNIEANVSTDTINTDYSTDPHEQKSK